MNMLEMTKTVLEKVSFDRNLFQKELKKATKWLKRDDVLLLQAWCISTFGSQYSEVIRDTFSVF